ncbi:MAG: hypothetical protein WDA42_00595 [Candidatus Bathyarchaeia archaeon]
MAVEAKIIGVITPDILVSISKYDTIYFADSYDCYIDSACMHQHEFKIGDKVYIDNWHFVCDVTDLLKILNNIN